jgi:hypothetical protein
MRLVCQKAFLLAVVVAFACHDPSTASTAPPPFSGFTLDNINGRPLPTFVSPIPEGPTILSGTLFLDGSGKVVMTERQRDINQGDFTTTNTLDYRIIGDKIEIGCFRPYPATKVCTASFGTISGTTLSLTIDPTQPLVYTYKLSARPD